METRSDFIGVNDKPALLGISSLDWLEAAISSLTEQGYKIQQAVSHADFFTNFSQVPYEVVVIEEAFGGQEEGEAAAGNLSLAYLQSLPANQRLQCTIILVGDSFTTYHTLQAFQQGVHMVVNRSEIALLGQFIQKAVADNSLFLQPYQEAQKRLIRAA